MAYLLARKMKTYKNTYEEIISLKNLIQAYKRARKGKTKKNYIKNFEENLAYNLKILHDELKNQAYRPEPLKTFILRDPKTRKISKSVFRDRIVHHAIIRIIEPIFEKSFIHDSCANRKGKGTIFAVQRFEKFQRKISHNFSKEAFCLKADIRHYFQEINREIIFRIIKRKIKCKKTLCLIKLIIWNFEGEAGMPLGNLTSQFFANVYLNELDQFVKHKLKIKYYIRYVDDFVILHNSINELETLKKEIDNFIKEKLRLGLHEDKSNILSLSRKLEFIGFRNFYYFRILRKRTIKNIENKLTSFKNNQITQGKFVEIFSGWNACAKWSNYYKLKSKLVEGIIK
jgi:hypothetical protein